MNYDPNDPTNKAELAEHLKRERERPITKKIADEADQVSQRSAVVYGALGVVIAVIVTSCAALAIHGF